MATYPTDTQYIWDFLVTAIGNECGVAGLMGNMYAESGFLSFQLQGDVTDPNRTRSHQYTRDVDNHVYTRSEFISDNKGYGLCQWTIEYRKTNMYDFINPQPEGQGNSISDLMAQLQFLMKELRGEYPRSDYSHVLDVISNVDESKPTEAIKTASNIVLFEFENPAEQGAVVQHRRQTYSIDVYNTYSGSQPVPPIPPYPPHDRTKTPLYFYITKSFKRKKGLIL